MWDFPGPGLEPLSPALAGGFLTTSPPGKPRNALSSVFVYLFMFASSRNMWPPRHSCGQRWVSSAKQGAWAPLQVNERTLKQKLPPNQSRSWISQLSILRRCCHQPVERNWIYLGGKEIHSPWLYIFSNPQCRIG